MRALLVNAVCGIRSTGQICVNQARNLETQGYTVKIAYGRESVPAQYEKYGVRIGNTLDVYFHAFMGRFFDQRGWWSKSATKKFLKWADEYNPDLLWLHNIHDYFINIDLFFEWIKSRPQMKVIWTQHDCWSFTGGCMHFTRNNCYQWKEKCELCPRRKHKKLRYLEKVNYLRKKEAFTGVKQMKIVAVSHWLELRLKDSFLNEYPIEVSYNEIDKSVFKETPGFFRLKYGLKGKKIILGVATAWSEEKGLYGFFELSKLMGDEYAVVLVGLNKKQITKIPANIVGIPQTNSAQELAEIYTAADVFVNLGIEETFGMTTLEALSCGTPAIVYKDTACEEIADNYGGMVVEQSLYAVKSAIEMILG